MNVNELIDFLLSEGYKNVRELEDGTIVGTIGLMFTTAICIDLDVCGYDKRFCFESHDTALLEISKLKSGNDEPSGYIARRNR